MFAEKRNLGLITQKDKTKQKQKTTKDFSSYKQYCRFSPIENPIWGAFQRSFVPNRVSICTWWLSKSCTESNKECDDVKTSSYAYRNDIEM